MQIQQPLGIVEQHVPRPGQEDLLADAIEEPGPQLFFQHPHLRADRRLGAEELFGGHGKAPVDRHGVEVANLVEVHVAVEKGTTPDSLVFIPGRRRPFPNHKFFLCGSYIG